MKLDLQQLISRAVPSEAKALLTLMRIVPIKEAYDSYLQNRLGSHHDYAARETILKSNFFTGAEFLTLLHGFIDTNSDRSGVSIDIASILLKKAIEKSLISDNSIVGPMANIGYHWNVDHISKLNELNILDNALLGSIYIAEKYKESVTPIVVQKNGIDHIGTGFLASTSINQTKKIIVTVKHNIDPNEGIIFKNFGEGSQYSPLLEDWIVHPDIDLALMVVEVKKDITPIYALGDGFVLDTTITLGYPKIATTDAAYLMANLGEVNSVVKTYIAPKREFLIFSNKASPGSSGSPVLDEAGLCIGIVTNAFETDYEGGMTTANAAIPASDIKCFIEGYFSS